LGVRSRLSSLGAWLPSPGHVLLAAAAFLCVFGSGLAFLRAQSRGFESQAQEVRVEAQNMALEAQLTGLNGSLGNLVDSFLTAGGVAAEARSLLGLPPAGAAADMPVGTRVTPPSRPGPLTDELVFASVQVEEALIQARNLNRSFHEIVSHMERQSEVWACLPTTGPLHTAQLTSGFGRRRDPFTGRMAWHRGLDLAAPIGTPVHASAEGRVIRAGNYGNYGNLVEIDHGNGIRTRYAHNSRLAVHVGEWVKRGEVVAYVGQTGRASAPHCHYEVLLDGEPVNPRPYIVPDLAYAD